MAQTVRLKLNGKPFDLRPLTPTLEKMRGLLDSSPADELFDTLQLSKLVGKSVKSLRSDNATFVDPLPEYTARVGTKRYWGNPKAIAELRRQTGQ
jgi:hypothetical protein